MKVKYDVILGELREQDSGLDISALTEVSTVEDSDYLIMIRDGKAYKILASKVTGGGTEIPTNAVTYNGEAIYYNGELIIQN